MESVGLEEEDGYEGVCELYVGVLTQEVSLIPREIMEGDGKSLKSRDEKLTII